MNISNFSFSKHAIDRILDMNVEASEVRECLEFPIRIELSHDNSARTIYYGERIACIVQDKSGDVVTVVWRTAEHWQRDLALAEYGGRRFSNDEWW